ncbi:MULTISPECIES: cryptochrome/photolyase family protein [Arthrobacter]|uniref:cryptochrome/photolyase family protein n=1 Tax=Arthrobacter TaxID=1663 RepID=UPI0033938089
MRKTALSAINVVWFRDDLRLADHPALSAAMADTHVPTVAVFVLDEESEGIRPLGAGAKWWLHHSLVDLSKDLDALNVPLVLLKGPAAPLVTELVSKLCTLFGLPANGLSMHWNRRYGGGERSVDTEIKAALRELGCSVSSYSGTLLHEPWVVKTKEERHYKVFTPFYNALLALPLRPELPAPERAQEHLDLDGLRPGSSNDDLESWELLPKAPDWSAGLAKAWTPGEGAAHERLALVLDEVAAGYLTGRDRPGSDETSRLSPALRWGHLSPVQVWEALGALAAANREAADGARAIMRQLAWRDFCWNQLYHQPHLHQQNLRPEFDGFDWSWPTTVLPVPGSAGAASGASVSGSGESEPGQAIIDELYTAWCRGESGFPLVDAGMRQLWQIGWMHNRVRMVVASLLVKNLGIHWRAGEAWFWDTLVDADAASNPANWQWVAGCGTDAAPYFRVFNPVLQAKKFDPHGRYQAQFAPTLSHEPVVDLKESRAAALAAYEHMKQSARSGEALL